MKKFLFVTGIAIALLPLVTSAQGLVPQCDGPSCTICDLIKLAHNVINYAIQISFVLAIAMVVFGGYTLLTSAGSEEKVTSSRKIMWYAVLGLALVLASWAIVNTFFLILVKAPSVLPWKWNENPGNCAATEIKTDISGEEIRLRARNEQVRQQIRAEVEVVRTTLQPYVAALPESERANIWSFFNDAGAKDEPIKKYFDSLAPATAAAQKETFRQYMTKITGLSVDAAKADELSGVFTPGELQFILYGTGAPATRPAPNTTPFPSPDDSSFGA